MPPDPLAPPGLPAPRFRAELDPELAAVEEGEGVALDVEAFARWAEGEGEGPWGEGGGEGGTGKAPRPGEGGEALGWEGSGPGGRVCYHSRLRQLSLERSLYFAADRMAEASFLALISAIHALWLAAFASAATSSAEGT